MSNMSHEIRTPMTGVIGMLELLRETALSEDQIEFVEIAHVSARRLMRLLDDILDFSKIEAGKVALESIPIDIRGIVTEVPANFATQAGKKGLELSLDIDPSIPARVLGDPTRVRQVLANLVSNSVKFTEQGHILISLRQVGTAAGRSRLRFEISDTGIGIPDTQLDTIFDSFVQADSSTTRRYGGTGLGLAICAQLVSLMGGRIDVQSTQGQGSTFSFTLTMPIVSLHDRSTATMPFSEIQALVIDEETTARYVLAQHLRQWGIGVIETTDLDKAEALLLSAAKRNEEMTLVFLRYGIGDQSQWIAELHKQLDYQAPQFVLIADEQPDDSSAYDGVLRRPIRLSELHNIVIRCASLPDTAFSPLDGSAETIAVEAGRILLAEDDPMNWKIVVRALSPLGYITDLARDGQEAITMIQQHDYTVILMDVHMPQMDGLEATRRIRELAPPKSEIPIIALTASVLNEEQQIYLDAGMNAFLGKPFSIEQLRKTVQHWSNHSSGT
jgi:CheY-like chemotaxis protein